MQYKILTNYTLKGKKLNFFIFTMNAQNNKRNTDDLG